MTEHVLFVLNLNESIIYLLLCSEEALVQTL